MGKRQLNRNCVDDRRFEIKHEGDITLTMPMVAGWRGLKHTRREKVSTTMASVGKRQCARDVQSRHAVVRTSISRNIEWKHEKRKRLKNLRNLNDLFIVSLCCFWYSSSAREKRAPSPSPSASARLACTAERCRRGVKHPPLCRSSSGLTLEVT